MKEGFDHPEVLHSGMKLFFGKYILIMMDKYTDMYSCFEDIPDVLEKSFLSKKFSFFFYAKVLINKFLNFFIQFYVYVADKIEKVLFLNLPYFKNHGSGTSIFAKTIWTGALLLILFRSDSIVPLFPKFLKDCDGNKLQGEAFVGMVVAIFGLYWNHRSVYVNKWTYIIEMFNKISMKEYNQNEDGIVFQYYEMGLFVFDCFRLKMYRNKSFTPTVYCYLIMTECFLAYREYVNTKKSVFLTDSEVLLVIENAKKSIQKNYDCCVVEHNWILNRLNGFHGDIENYLFIGEVNKLAKSI